MTIKRREFLVYTGAAVACTLPVLRGCVDTDDYLPAVLARLAEFANHDVNVLGLVEVRRAQTPDGLQLITPAGSGISSSSIS